VLHRPTPERVSGFSDGVFAVLITVLVFNLRPPGLPTFGAFLLLWPTWLSCAVSYLFIAIIWTNHHYLMRYATEANLRARGRAVMWGGRAGEPDCSLRWRPARQDAARW